MHFSNFMSPSFARVICLCVLYSTVYFLFLFFLPLVPRSCLHSLSWYLGNFTFKVYKDESFMPMKQWVSMPFVFILSSPCPLHLAESLAKWTVLFINADVGLRWRYFWYFIQPQLTPPRHLCILFSFIRTPCHLSLASLSMQSARFFLCTYLRSMAS